MAKRAVCYLMSHPDHMMYLVTSIWTLRRYWDGPIFVNAWIDRVYEGKLSPGAYKLAKIVEKDDRLGISVHKRDPGYRGKNAQFLDKISMMQNPGGDDDFAEISMYLDADTQVCGRIDFVMDIAEEYGFAATQFNRWETTGKIIQNRVNRLQLKNSDGTYRTPSVEQKWVTKVLSNRYPSVNGGVFACKPDSPVLPVWGKWAYEARFAYISDETVLHILPPKVPNLSSFLQELTNLRRS